MKLLIADDEIQIRTGIKEAINWISFGIDEVFTASNGLEALEIFKRHAPEIVITDIKMPGLDGLELSREIRKISQFTQIIILSGYAEFEYSKQAIQLGVTDYELKPVKIKELIRLVTVAKDKVQCEMRRKAEEEQHLSLYKTKILSDLFSGNNTDNKTMADLLRKTSLM